MYKKIHHIISFRINWLKKKITNSVPFCRFKLKYILPLGFNDKAFLDVSLDDIWKKRIKDVMDCPDNKLIKRVPEAGTVKNGRQVMHNGIVITAGGYYGDPIVQMLYKNRGVHEPQEELAFEAVLKTIQRGGTMIEFGAYWSFYSIWFNKSIKDARNFLVEPDILNMQYGINNFKLNHAEGKFTHALVGKISGMLENIPVISVDDYVLENKTGFIDILHADIQGFEYEMLLGASRTIADRKIGYFFISTHGNKLHYQCMDFLKANGFKILCSADEENTYSLDGLIVARSHHYHGLEKIDISAKTKTSIA